MTTQVMAEMAKPRDTFILARGDYRNQTEKVTPGVPSHASAACPRTRPPIASAWREWLFSPQHPLTARVAVNRYWQLYFGTGLVKTTEDFGSQGDAPVQRDVLDWLAVEFQTQLGREGHAAPDRHFGHLSPVVARQRRNFSRRTRRIACSRAVRASACPPRWCATMRSPSAD